MPRTARTSFRRVAAALSAVVLVTAFGPVAWGQVTSQDVAAAETAADEAAARLSEVRDDLASTVELRDRMAATLESLTSRRETAGESAASEAVAVRSRLTRMYMVAGRPDVLLAQVSDIGRYFTRLAYLGAIADRDRAAVNRFTLVVEDLGSLRDQAVVELEELAGTVAALELLAASRSVALDDATARLAAARAEWAKQEAARQAALEAETRRQEAELARQLAATTSTTTTTTTTAPPVGATTTTTTTTTTAGSGFSTDDGGYSYSPSGGVEQWRSLLTSVFARWGLDREKCGPNGCLGSHVDDALTIMWCESRGVPFAVNPSSGTTGLFQHRPVYWAERVARARSHVESAGMLPADATPYNPSHNIEVAALLIWESRETLIGNLSMSGPWDDGPQPFGHWDGTARYCADPPLVWP